jgi:thiol-disulfide isomerase/thioredoxin
MVKFLDYVTTRLRPYSFHITAAIVIIIFSIAGYYSYNTIMKTKIGPDSKFSDVANNGSTAGEADIKFFYVDWCPYCKNALPEWQSFCDEYNGKIVNNYMISCSKSGTNCTDDESPEVKSMMAKYEIQSYPTVILFKDDKRYDFDAKVTKNALEKFIQSATSG